MRLALVPLDPVIGDIAGNAANIAAWIERARGADAEIVVFPELALCGYPPRDLLLREGFVAACAREAQRLGESATRGIAAVFGVPLPLPPHGSGIANAIVVYRDGRLVATHHKRLLPTYDVFDEDRYFTPGDRAVVFEHRAGDASVHRVGLSICEDLWKGEDAGFASRYASAPDPVAELAAAGCSILLSPSASPFVLGKGQRHRDILQRHARQHAMTVVSVNQSGGNDELVFDGHAVAYDPHGTLCCAARGFAEEMVLLDLPGVRKPAMHHLLSDPLSQGAPEELLFRALVSGTRDYLKKTGFTLAVLGISGGIDSAVTCAIAACALGPPNITGLLLPSKYSSAGSLADANDLATRLSVRTITIPIEHEVEALRSSIDPAFAAHGLRTLGQQLPDLAEENLQSRVRGTILMAWSNRSGAMVLTTGNKSELAVGYCTLYGDMNGGLAVLSDVSKQWVYRLARWMNANHEAAGFARPPIPESSIIKPPSAELRPDQKDQDSLPPYDVLDAIIEHLVEGRQSIAHAAKELGFDPALVARIARMIDLAEYKRRQAATGLKVTSVAFGTGRRMPIAQRWRE
jgi:NAD+ synthetase